jgi:multisubunit Na+/H+ antiporter MnhB subunit
VLTGVGIALTLVAMDYFRRGSVVLAGSVLLAAFLRLFLPDREAGLLVVRSRKIDVAVLGVLGALLALFAFWVPPPR